MASLPYLQLYVSDYLADTMHLSLEEHGAYLLIIFNYWQRGKPPLDDDKKLAGICSTPVEQWLNIRSTVEEFFDIKDGFWFHKRIEKDLEYVKRKSLLAQKAGQASGRARAIKSGKTNRRSTSVEQTMNHKDKDKEVNNKTLVHFDNFWKAYPKKKNKGQAEKAWKRIKPGKELLEKILNSVSKAKTSKDWLKDNGQFIPYPASWLNAKGWEDEFEQQGRFD